MLHRAPHDARRPAKNTTTQGVNERQMHAWYTLRDTERWWYMTELHA